MQSRLNFERGDYASATDDVLVAAGLFLDSENESQLQRSINVLLTNLLPNLNSKDFEGIHDLDLGFNNLLNKLNENNENNRYSDTIRFINFGISKAKSTTPPTPPPTSIG